MEENAFVTVTIESDAPNPVKSQIKGIVALPEKYLHAFYQIQDQYIIMSAIWLL